MDTIMLMLALFLAGGEAPQQAQVRHYQTEIHQIEDGNLQQLHMMIGSDGRMGAVLFIGPAGGEPTVMAVSGPRTYTNVDGQGTAAFCFTVDDVEGPIMLEDYAGEVSCWTWARDDTVYETGSVPFGERTSPPLTWCGEEHFAPSAGDTPPRVGL